MASAPGLSGSDNALLLLGQLVQTDAPLDVIRHAIEDACRELNLHRAAEENTRNAIISSDFYLG